MQEKVKTGVIGVGALGQWHAKIYSQLPAAELIGVYDINTRRAEKIARIYRAKVYREIEELASDIEAVSIAVPADKHFEVASLLIEHGVHILVEKPIATRTCDAEELVVRAQKHGIVLQVGHVERFNPVMPFLEGLLDFPRFIECHRLSPYPKARPGQQARGTEISVVLDLMIHDLEVIMHLLHSPVREIAAVGVPVLSSSEDIANVRLSFDNGCVANITASRISPKPMRKIRIFQKDIYISLDYQNQTGELYRKSGSKITRRNVPIEKGEPLFNELSSFVNCVRTHNKPVVSGEEGYAALKLAVRICQQLQKHSS